MDRRIVSTLFSRLQDWRRPLSVAATALATTDGRWALVSTSMTALVAGAMAWLAAGAMSPVHPKRHEVRTTFMPYTLFSQLAQVGGKLTSASLFPSAVITPSA